MSKLLSSSAKMAPVEGSALQDVPIAQLRRQLEDGDRRFPDSPYRLSFCWYPVRPEPIEELLSSYEVEQTGNEGAGVSDARAAVTQDFWEEINLLNQWMESSNTVLPLAEWQKGDAEGAGLFHSLNRRAAAFQLWESYAVPLRLKNGHVFRIHAPRDVFGTPIIYGMSFAEFATALAEKSARDVIDAAEEKKRFDRWQAAAIILGVLALMAFLV